MAGIQPFCIFSMSGGIATSPFSPGKSGMRRRRREGEKEKGEEEKKGEEGKEQEEVEEGE